MLFHIMGGTISCFGGGGIQGWQMGITGCWGGIIVETAVALDLLHVGEMPWVVWQAGAVCLLLLLLSVAVVLMHYSSSSAVTLLCIVE